MKLLNQSISLISVSIFVIIGIWAVVFYFHMIGEIKESVDEGLNNYRKQIVYQAHQDTVLLRQVNFNEGYYAIEQISKTAAFKIKDRYSDTLMPIQKGKTDLSNLESFRMLTTAFEDDKRYYKLRLISPMVEKDELIEQLFKTTIWLYAALIVSILFINNYVLRRVWQPFYHFLGQLKNYQIGSKEKFPRVKTKTKEFNDLQKATHSLLKQNLINFEQQKEFIGNASHELQTPLAIAINKLELLIEKENLTNEQATEVGEVIGIIERLIRLNKSLLLLTKIKNQQFTGSEMISVNSLVKNGLEEMSEIAAYRRISIQLKEEGNLQLTMDPSLAEILFHNLLRNAIYHNQNPGKVEILISKNTFRISNSGQLALDASTIFQRFQKASPSSESTGLGLSIVKAICEIYDFSLDYLFRNQKHQFILRLKK